MLKLHRPLCALLLLASCDADDPSTGEDSMSATTGEDDSSTSDASVESEQVVERALEYASFEKINEVPLQSQHGLADAINVWVPAAYAEAYRTLSSDTRFEPGTLLVKEHLDASGSMDGMTVMFKGPPGYAPDVSDWWFGLISGQGEVVVEGQPSACVGCHAGVQETDYVFGTPP